MLKFFFASRFFPLFFFFPFFFSLPFFFLFFFSFFLLFQYTKPPYNSYSQWEKFRGGLLVPVRSSRKLLRLRRRRRRRLLRVAPERDFSTPVSESRSNKEMEKKGIQKESKLFLMQRWMAIKGLLRQDNGICLTTVRGGNDAVSTQNPHQTESADPIYWSKCSFQGQPLCATSGFYFCSVYLSHLSWHCHCGSKAFCYFLVFFLCCFPRLIIRDTN